MNGYPYPVLTELDSAYSNSCRFAINFTKYGCQDDKLSLHIDVSLTADSLKEYINNGDAELVIKIVTDIRSMVFHFDALEDNLVIEVDAENIRANDVIKITAFIVTKKSFVLKSNDEIADYFGNDYSINMRKGDILAISNDEKLNYNTSNNDFIKITSSADRDGKGIKIRLSNDNHIEILVGTEFKRAYARAKKPELSPILNSHIIFETIVFTLIDIAQNKEDHSQKEWYRLFSQAYLATGETIESFRERARDEDYIDVSYVFEMAQLMINNSLETSIINVSKMGDK